MKQFWLYLKCIFSKIGHIYEYQWDGVLGSERKFKCLRCSHTVSSNDKKKFNKILKSH